MDWTWYLFSFEGRINRAKMWLAVLVILCWMIFLGVLTVTVGSCLRRPHIVQLRRQRYLRILDPATYRSLSTTGLVHAGAKAIGTALFALGLPRHLDQAAA